ncbi:MAG: hypothetical protein COA62_15520 [Rhodobiaceae bacterium]|nr:MAG: hypothetical protein COA62_15520 [Rhodobiaceae bacterium]
MLKVSKKNKTQTTGLKLPKEGVKNRPSRGQKVTFRGSESDPTKKVTLKEENLITSRAPTASVAVAVEKAKSETRQRRDTKIAAAKKKPTVASLELVWRSAIEDNDLYAFSSFIPWTVKERGMMKNFMKSVQFNVMMYVGQRNCCSQCPVAHKFLSPSELACTNGL